MISLHPHAHAHASQHSQQTCVGLQLEAKGLECALWEQKAREAVDKENAMQQQLSGTREQVNQTSAMMEQHLANYSQYQATITQSNQVGDASRTCICRKCGAATRHEACC